MFLVFLIKPFDHFVYDCFLSIKLELKSENEWYTYYSNTFLYYSSVLNASKYIGQFKKIIDGIGGFDGRSIFLFMAYPAGVYSKINSSQNI